MSLSDEAHRRFLAYADNTDPSNLDPASDDELFEFIGWALVHEPGAMSEHYAYDRAMTDRSFTEVKSADVHTVIHAGPPIVAAYERALSGVRRRA